MIISGIVLLLLLLYLFCLPKQLFTKPTSTVLFDKNGELLAAKVASDQQWRFAGLDSVPKKMEICILTFEDKHFYQHPGVSVRAIARAIKQNVTKGKILSGGSTITMQVVRLMRNNPPRTFPEKIKEMILATRVECSYSKKEILNMYLSNAPFGNNIVGLSAASWRYYGKKPEKLSWAESATLAVLPNAPGLIYPGKNHDRLLNKRNRLLKRLLNNSVIDTTQYLLAITEPLPEKPLPVPMNNMHLMQRFILNEGNGKTMYSSIDASVQSLIENIIRQHIEHLHQNEINNAAAIVTDLKTGKVIAYVGNSFNENDENSNQVDCANAPRSSGSILKPILFAKSIEAGLITPTSLLPDMPSYFGGFNPKNYNKTYDGAVPADECLIRSLNIPMVYLLNEYGVGKFQNDLHKAGFQSIKQNTKQYGLSLILGGAEVSLNELNQVYSCMAMQLLGNSKHPVSFYKDKKVTSQINNINLQASSIYATFEVMKNLNRPDEMGNSYVFESSQPIAWKTGTSFGNRDAWAVGITPDYVVCVWVGNASGEGRPSLTGVHAAAPILFDIFNQLPTSKGWFKKPVQEYCKVAICKKSGYKAGEYCNEVDSLELPNHSLQVGLCPYHQSIQLNQSKQYRVNADMELPSKMVHENYFILPPLMQKYFLLKHPDYKMMPPFKNAKPNSFQSLQIVYPKKNSKLLIPKQLDGQKEKLVFEAVSALPGGIIYWHMDGLFIGTTKGIHQLSFSPEPGKHILTLVDGQANTAQVAFDIAED